MPFWRRFRAEFKQSTFLWLFQLPLIAVLVFYCMLVFLSEIHYVFKLLSGIIIAFLFMWTQLWFGYESKFEDSLKTVLLNSLRITLANMGTAFLLAILCIVTVALSFVFIVYFPPIMLLIPGAYLWCYTGISRKLCEKILAQTEPQE